VRATLESAGIVAPDLEARRIVEAALGTDSPGALLADAPPDAATRAEALARRRAAGEPLQYVTGVAGFRYLELGVGPGVFIPRPETELVAERAMERLPSGGVAVDLGTGSGAIALAIATERPDSRVFATEASPDALAYARANRARVGADVTLAAGDLFDALPASLRERVDVVVSNPPYVPVAESSLLPRDVVDHEPHVALFADGGGLDIVRRIAAGARAWLRPGGWVVLEIGDRQGDAVTELLRALDYSDVAVSRDLTDRERIAEARR
jgi:release factor glutamine methyltransferase